MILLAIGDVMGSAGRDALTRALPGIIHRHKVDFVLANGENLAHGAGITGSTAATLFAAGVDVITGGNHTWDRPEADDLLRAEPRVLRPANYPSSYSGRGSGVFRTRSGLKVGVLNLLGRVFMPEPEVDDPFKEADRSIEELRRETPILVVDFHAEATSEKTALALHLAGRASLVYGTHTHVATADERVLAGGTAFMADVGLTGSYDSVIGVDKAAALRRFLDGVPHRLEPATADARLSGLLVDIDPRNGQANWVRRIEVPVADAAGQDGSPRTARLLKGAPVAARVLERAAARASALRAQGVVPTLALLSVGEDPASRVYLGKKKEAAERAGIDVRERRWGPGDDPATLMKALADLGRDPSVHGVLLQLPLPEGWDTNSFIADLPPDKDVDGFHPVNAGRLAQGLPGFVPCTPLGIREMLHFYEVPLAGRAVTVVGRSGVVGRPLATLLGSKGEDATVTVAHSRTRDLFEATRSADVLIVAMGQPEAIGPEHVKPGAVVIDVGVHRVNGKLVGDVDAAGVSAVASALSPVPGGVGPLTVAFLLQNTVLAAERAKQPSEAKRR
jgi:metallophosphoesterase (TIGR00282 family)